MEGGRHDRAPRIREGGFGTKKDAEDFVVGLRVQAKRGKHGLERDRPRVTVQKLVKDRLLDMGKRSIGKQSKRILESLKAAAFVNFHSI